MTGWAAATDLDYWEALHEPPWDIGWGDRATGPGRRLLPEPPHTGTDEPWFLPAPLSLERPVPPVPVPPALWAYRIEQALLRDWQRGRQRHRLARYRVRMRLQQAYPRQYAEAQARRARLARWEAQHGE